MQEPTIKMKKLFLTIIVTFMLCIPAMAQQSFYGRIMRVIDADTVEVKDSSEITHKIRLAGIDAPEVSQPGWAAADEYLRQVALLAPVYVTTTKLDRDGRLIGRIVTEDGILLNYALLAKGHAWFYREYADELGVEDRLLYEAAERTAKEKLLGLWRSGDAIAPWEWRHRTAPASPGAVTTSTGQPAKNAAADNPNVRTAPTSQPSNSGYIRGPRGGCYTITSSGKKRYVDRSLCN
jgi:endonuclease YncB( thermonuclease family)